MVKKKGLILLMVLLIPLLFNNAYSLHKNECLVINDAEIQQNNPTNNYGTLTTLDVRLHTSQARRIFAEFNCSSIITGIVKADVCYYIQTNNAGTSRTEIYYVNGSWNETNITWDNQPTYNTTLIDFKNVDSPNEWVCFNVTEQLLYEWGLSNTTTNFSFLLKTLENDTAVGNDVYRSKENANPQKPILNITMELDTNLELIHETVFQLNSTNLVQANYTLDDNQTIILNATCNITFDGDSAIMSYNDTSTVYEVFVIPEEVGLFEFEVYCNKTTFQPQLSNSSSVSAFISGFPYNITVKMYEDLNATTPYIDEFAYILFNARDYNCSILTGFDDCWRVSEYVGGEANLNDTVIVGNLSLWYYSGELNQECELCPPIYETVNTLKFLGDFKFDSNRTELFLFVDVFELNFWVGVGSFASTWGMLIIGFVVALSLAVGVFWVSGKNIAVGFMVFVLTLWFLMAMGIIPDISDGLSLIFS